MKQSERFSLKKGYEGSREPIALSASNECHTVLMSVVDITSEREGKTISQSRVARLIMGVKPLVPVVRNQNY